MRALSLRIPDWGSRIPSRLAAVLAAISLMLSLVSCSPSIADDGVLRVYATTGYLADAIHHIAPDAQVTTMVGPGGDPHTYQPSTRDIQRMHEADLVLWNGLHLEAQMIRQLESFGEHQLAVGTAVPTQMLLALPESDADGNPLYDPHIWNSPAIWQLVVTEVAEKLAELFPERASEFRENAEQYRQAIVEAEQQVELMLAAVPDDRRILITGHDAFSYFGQSFEFAVYATDFISTEAALSAQQLSDLASLIAEQRIPVIFFDNQANPQAITSLKEAVQSRGWQVEVSPTELYADSLGAEPGVDTTIGVLIHNAAAIADALGEESP